MVSVWRKNNALQHFRGVIGQPRTFDIHQGDMPAVLPVFEAINHVGLAQVTRYLGNPDLGVIEFLQHGHRQVDMMLLKLEEG